MYCKRMHAKTKVYFADGRSLASVKKDKSGKVQQKKAFPNIHARKEKGKAGQDKVYFNVVNHRR